MAREIESTRGYFFIVDDEDVPIVSQFSWYTTIGKSLSFHTEYSPTKWPIIHQLAPHLPREWLKKKRKLPPELFILKFNPITHFVSFANHNRNDFRKENLRIIPIQYLKLHRASPEKNRYMYRGVTKKKSGYMAFISEKTDGVQRQRTISGIETIEEAALAYNQMAKELYGEYAYLNIIGQDSRKPHYAPRLDTNVSRATRSLEEAQGVYLGSEGRYHARWYNRHLYTTMDLDIAAFAVNLASLQATPKTVIKNPFPHQYKWEQLFFHTPMQDSPTLMEYCLTNQLDSVSLFRLLVEGYSLEEALHLANDYNPNETSILFEKRNQLYGAWHEHTFLGYFRTEDDARYAVNHFVDHPVYLLPYGFKGSPYVIHEEATIPFEKQLYPSLYSFAKAIGVSLYRARKLLIQSEKAMKIDHVAIEELQQTIQLVEGLPIQTYEELMQTFTISEDTLRKARKWIQDEGFTETYQMIYDLIFKKKMFDTSIRYNGTTYPSLRAIFQSCKEIKSWTFYKMKKEYPHKSNEELLFLQQKLIKERSV